MSTQSKSTRCNVNTSIIHLIDIMSTYYQSSGRYSMDVVRHALHHQEERRRVTAFESMTNIRENYLNIEVDLLESMLNEPDAWKAKPLTATGVCLSQAMLNLSSRYSELIKFCNDKEAMLFFTEDFERLIEPLSRVTFNDISPNKKLLDDFNNFLEVNLAVRELLQRGASITAVQNFTGLSRDLINKEMFNDVMPKVTGKIVDKDKFMLMDKINDIPVDNILTNEVITFQTKMDYVFFLTSKIDPHWSFSAIQHILRSWRREQRYTKAITEHKIKFLCDIFVVDYHEHS